MKTFAFFLFYTVLANAEIFKSTLHRLDSRGLLKNRFAINPRFSRQKIGSSHYAQTPLFTEYDSFFVMNISLGTPAQWFTVLPAMETSDMFVVDAACTTQPCKNFPESGYTRKQYDSNKSATYEKQGDYFEIGETVNGYYAFDTMQVGEAIVKHQEFGLAEFAAIGFGYEPIDGFFGIGLSDPTSSVISPIRNLVSQFEEPIFTIWLDAIGKTAYESKGGMITFGGIDTQHCNNQVVYASMSDRDGWQFKIDGVKIGDYSASVQGVSTIVLGEVMIFVPKEHFGKIMRQIGATCDGYTLCKINCSAVPTAPDLILDIGGAQLAVPASEYTLKMNYSANDCEIAMDFTESGTNSWSFGSPFMRKFCSVFDVQNERIGFAEAIKS